jgi:hypothetical protein
MKDLAGYALCAAAGSLAHSGLWIAGIALFVAGLAHLLATTPARNTSQ